MLALAASVLTVAGCRHSCNTTASSNGAANHRLIGSGKQTDVCYDPSTGYPIGMPVSGPASVYPGTLIPGNGVPLLPGPTGLAPNELPFPGSTIPPAGIPFAPPTTAPGDMGPNAALPLPRNAVPVKNEK